MSAYRSETYKDRHSGTRVSETQLKPQTTLTLLSLRPYHYVSRNNDDTLSELYLAILGCTCVRHPDALLGRVCRISPSDAGIEYLQCGWVYISPNPLRGTYGPRLFPLSPATIERCRDHIELKTVYISRPELAAEQSEDARRQPHETINLILLKATRDALCDQGYNVELRGPDEDHSTTHWLILSHDDHAITVQYQHALGSGGRWLEIEAEVKLFLPAADSTGQVEADDGLLHWTDDLPWLPSLDTQEVVFTLPTKRLTVKLGLALASRSHYFLSVEIVEEKCPEVMTIGSSERDNSVGHLGSTAKQVSETSSPSGGKQS